jgi:hypothetical protein
MGRPATPRRVRLRMVICAAISVGLSGCSRESTRTPAGAAGAANASDEMGEPHDQSAFAKDPSQTHLMSPDEPDLHPPEPGEAAKR